MGGLVKSLVDSIASIVALLVLLVLFIFIFALLGMQVLIAFSLLAFLPIAYFSLAYSLLAFLPLVFSPNQQILILSCLVANLVLRHLELPLMTSSRPASLYSRYQ